VKKKMVRGRESMSMEVGYNQNVELETVYQPGSGDRYMPLSGSSRV
jgi:hypothetical protein